MLGGRQEQTVWKNIRKYLKKEGRVGFQLRQLAELLRISPLRSYKARLLDHSYSLSSAFKLFLLLHRLLIDRNSDSALILDLLFAVRFKSASGIEEVLAKRLMGPYRLFLQRRSLGMGRGGGGEGEVRVYQLLNLINLGTSFADVIYTLGRYYMGRFGWAVDFNITLGADLQGLYGQMVESVARPASKAILQEIEAVHEKMYVVFYNCYFHKYLKIYVPKWVITDVNIWEGRTSLSPQKDSAQSTLSRSGTAKQRSCSLVKGKAGTSGKGKVALLDLGESCLFLNQKLEEEVYHDPEVEDRIIVDMIKSEESSNKHKELHSLRIDEMQSAKGERLKLLLSMERVIKAL